MKTKINVFAAALAGLAMMGCSDEMQQQGEGAVMLSASFNPDVKVVSRTASADLADIYGESLDVWISNSKGLVRRYQGLSELPADAVPMLSGNYVAEAWAGDSVSASWDKKWFKARVPFTVEKGVQTAVQLDCRIANVVVSVEYADDVAAVLADDISLQVAHTRGSLTFEGFNVDGKKAYFMMPNGVTDLSWTLSGTQKADGTTLFTRTSTIENVQPAHEYVFKVSCQTQDDGELGGGYGLTIEIDDTEIYCAETIMLETAPIIRGSGFDIDQPVYCAPQEVGPRNIYVFASSKLESVLIESNQLGALIGNEDANDFDVMTMGDGFRSTLAAAGLTFNYTEDNAVGTSRLKIMMADEFTNRFLSGTYSFKISARDASGRTTVKTAEFDLSGNPVTATDVNPNDLSLTTSAVVLQGTINNAQYIDDGEKVYVNYREQQSRSRADWTTVEATVTGSNFSVALSGLQAGTTYEWTVTIGEFTSGVKTFTTEEALQLPNNGFEDWQASKAPYLIYAAGDNMFWDSGNHGSATMSKNVTTPDKSIKHSGERSIKLSSQFVGVGSIGKFAAGNVFIGKYLKTDGTDGILGFGRPFTGRPTKIHGYVKYNPAAINNRAGDAPSEYVKGEMDRGIIYAALLDNTTESYNGEEYPVIIKTKASERQLFNKDGANVIAYGEIIFTEATGDDMVEFEIVLDYKRNDVRPSYIMLTASASKGGDYFTGGPSTMWLDDITLEY